MAASEVIGGFTMKHFRRAVGALSSATLLGTFVVFAAGTGAVTTAASAAPSIVNPPRVPVSWPQPGGPGGPGAQGGVRNTWAASNWSGYAETGTFDGVSSTWTVPTVTASSSATYSSAWIGVDGFNNSDLIQTGTEEDYYNGAAHYNAWWEILPAAETALPSNYTVTAGDRMSANIYETSATTTVGGGGGGRFGRGGRGGTTEHLWDITISDTTRGWTFSTSQAYNGPGGSAEWVMEAPEVNGRIATLAHYTISAPSGIGDFDNAGVLTSIPSGTPTYTGAGLNYANDSGVMIQNNVQVSTPGDPDTALSAFNAAYGSALPATPAG
jgi:Peptidase A4 family